jgi:hypothetical protein
MAQTILYGEDASTALNESSAPKLQRVGRYVNYLSQVASLHMRFMLIARLLSKSATARIDVRASKLTKRRFS